MPANVALVECRPDGFVIGDAQPFSPGNLGFLGEYERDPFDAVRLTYDADQWVFDLIFSKISETRTFDQDANLAVAYLSYTGIEGQTLDLYFTWTTADGSGGVTAPGVFSQADVFNVGARAAGDIPMVEGLTYKVEGTYQFGDVDDLFGPSDDTDVDSFAIEAGLWYKPDMNYNPEFKVVYALLYADEDDSDLNTYLPFFTNRYYGQIRHALINQHVINVGAGFSPWEKWRLSADYYHFISVDDDIASPYTGGLLSADDSDDGDEVDLYVDYQITEELAAQVAGGIFFPGDLYGDTPGLTDDEATFVRASMSVKF
jgi:hypothetical protein